MPIHDKKKAHAIINACAEEVDVLKRSATRLEAIRTRWVSESVDPTGTPLEGNVSAASDWIDDVRSAADNAVANGLEAARRPSHGTHAMED